MTFTSKNRPSLLPPNFEVLNSFKTFVSPAPCAIFLRRYDVKHLMCLLESRGLIKLDFDLDTGEPTGLPVHYVKRNQGRAQRYHRWWRDSNSLIPKALFVLCAMTQELNPFERVPNCRHPSHPEYRKPPGPVMINGRKAEEPWARALRRRPLPPEPLLVAPHPFAQRDGSRYHPYGDINGDDSVGAVRAWLPRCVAERLAECGANFREDGVYGPSDPTGKFYVFNRSAGIRRLIEAWRFGFVGVRKEAMLAFRGIGMTAHRATNEEWRVHREHRCEMRAQLAEADARRAADATSAPLGRLSLMDDPSIVKNRTVYGRLSADKQAEYIRECAAAVRFEMEMAKLSLEDESESIVPEGTTETIQSGTLCEFNTSIDLKTGEFSTQIVEQTKPRQRRAPRKLRKDSISQFNPDELG
jgi:hypothetical protein